MIAIIHGLMITILHHKNLVHAYRKIFKEPMVLKDLNVFSQFFFWYRSEWLLFSGLELERSIIRLL